MLSKFNSLVNNIDISIFKYKQKNICSVFRNKIGWGIVGKKVQPTRWMIWRYKW